MQLQQPLLIAVEGIDGAGKSTLVQALRSVDWSGLRVATAATPGNRMREVCFDVRGRNPEASLLAFMLGNADVIASHRMVDVLILDRYVMSTLVHHRLVFERWSKHIAAVAAIAGVSVPALTVFLDIDEATAEERIARRSSDRPLLMSLSQQRDAFRAGLECLEAEELRGRVLIRPSLTLEDLEETRKIVQQEIQSMTNLIRRAT